MDVNEAIKSDGSVLRIGDEVEAKLLYGNGCVKYFRKCEGVVFIVEKIGYHPGCCSTGYMVVVHVKGSPERKMLGFKKEGLTFIDGLDADWFTKIRVDGKTV